METIGEKLQGQLNPRLIETLARIEQERQAYDKPYWTKPGNYKSSFLAEAETFKTSFLFNTQVYAELIGKEIRPQAEGGKITTEEIEQFLLDKGEESADLFNTIIETIYNSTLENLALIDEECDKVKHTIGRELTKEESGIIFFICEIRIDTTKKGRGIRGLKEFLPTELKDISEDIGAILLKRFMPEIKHLDLPSVKRLLKSKQAREVSAKKEGNLVEYPMAVLNKQGTGSFVDRGFVVYKDKKTGKEVSRIGTPYGPLTSFDLDVLTGAMSFYTETGDKGVLAFSDYKLLKTLGLTTRGGSNYRILKDSLKKISSITISITRFIKGTKETTMAVENCSLFSGSYLSLPRKATEGNPLQGNYLILNPLIKESLDLKYYTRIDMRTWNSLPTPTSRRLYEILLKRKGRNNPHYGEDIRTFCAKLPLETKNITKAKSILKRDLETLKGKGFIGGYSIAEGKVQVSFTPKTEVALLPRAERGKEAERQLRSLAREVAKIDKTGEGTGSMVLDQFISKPKSVAKPKITMAELEGKFETLKNTTTSEVYRQASEVLIKRYSSQFEEVVLRGFARKYEH